MRRLHGSALGLGLLLSGCGGDDGDETLPIVAFQAAACELPAGRTIQLEALGDFDASELTSETITAAAAGGADLSFPLDTQAVEARAEGGGRRFVGLGTTTGERAIDLLLLPEDGACDLYQPGSTRPYPLASGGEAVGLSNAHRLLLIAGGIGAAAQDSARALVIDLDTTEAFEVPDGMIPGRAHASISELGDDALLVAGGIDPSEGDPLTAPAVGTAIVYEIAEGRFDRANLITLARPRARHAAVVLLSGETLLVGGEAPEAMRTLDVISPVDRASRQTNVTELEHARIAPTALRLSDGRIFVAGGIDDGGDTVGQIEWISADASTHLGTRNDVRVARDAAFVAMPGGSVLALGACVPGSSPAERPECIPGQLARQLSWIRADGQVDWLEPLPFEPDEPAFVQASDGAPFLAATTPAGVRVLLRFNPWEKTFEAPDELPAEAPTQPFAVDPGMFVWLAPFGDAKRLRAFRHGTRNTWSRHVAPLLLVSGDHVAPDRAPGDAVKYQPGRLELSDGARAIVTDTTYDALELSIELAENGVPPRVALAGSLVGDAACPWPGEGNSLLLTRSGASVTLARGNERRICDSPAGRVSVELWAPEDGTSAIQSVSIRRSLD